jgi:hypothetical protein
VYNRIKVKLVIVEEKVTYGICFSKRVIIPLHCHKVSTLNKGKSALAEHACDTKHKIAWENSKVITIEAWHINMSNHALNRDDGAYLPEEYMHLIGK